MERLYQIPHLIRRLCARSSRSDYTFNSDERSESEHSTLLLTFNFGAQFKATNLQIYNQLLITTQSLKQQNGYHRYVNLLYGGGTGGSEGGQNLGKKP